MFDCIIVGAGPAGSTAAYHLSKQGHRVLILEKETLPRYKACSGGVSPIIQEWFDFDFTPVISTKANHILYTSNLSDPVEIELEASNPVWMVKRSEFDHFIVKQAILQGTELKDNQAVLQIRFEGDRWILQTATQSYSGKYIIAADGATGPMASWLGFKPPKTRNASVLEITTPSSSEVNFDMGLVKNGFLWNFPKQNGYSISATTLLGKDAPNLNSDLQKYQQQKNLPNGQIFEHPICFWDGDKKLHTQNAILAGEAAAIVDPLIAEGIRPAIFTGIKAAEAINLALGGNSDALANYSQIIKDEWGKDMIWAQRISAAFYRFPGIGYKVGVKNPKASQLMLDILCGKNSYGAIANVAIKRLTKGFFGGK